MEEYKFTQKAPEIQELLNAVPTIERNLSDEIERATEQDTDMQNQIDNVSKQLFDMMSKDLLSPESTLNGYFIRNTPAGYATRLTESEGVVIRKYSVSGGRYYAFSARYSKAVTINVLTWINANGLVIKQEYSGSFTEVKIWKDVMVTAPEGATEMWMNVRTSYEEYFDFSEIYDELSLERKIDMSKLMKVVVATLEGNAEDMPFYIRTKYNNEKDIILTHRINDNRLISFKATYIGPKSLADSDLMTSTYLVSSHGDSTAPIAGPSAYYALFAQHGLYVPYIENTTGMTADDVDSEWVDQLNRHFIVGKVTENSVILLPVIYKDANNHDTRDWVCPQDSIDITNLTHVSGGTHTEAITVETMHHTQLEPIMEHSNRKWVVDGTEIKEPGTYYCDTFSVSESQVGYDPATINDWFGSDGKPVLTDAEALCLFTFSFNYCGAQCSLNTTINVKRETDFSFFGAIQQQFFVDNGDYKAMIMIPKAADRDGVVIEKPYSPTKGYIFLRNATSLKDVDNPIDRQIGFLHNPTTDEYLVGMAAGLSLVSGDTITSKRIQNCAIGNTNKHRVGSTSYSETGSSGLTNKFYVAAINPSNFESDDYYYPLNYFKEVNAYVSYFDPAENVGQVYWYKDGGRYVIYAHCQTVQNNVAINVPPFMEGLRLSVVEKTTNAELLTDTIHNGKFFVNYNSSDANYIVLIAQ